MGAQELEYGMGYIEDEPDDRDILFSEFLMTTPEHRELSKPPAVDYTAEMSPVRNQGREGTCVGFATVVGLKEWKERKKDNKVQLSPRYVYCNARSLEPHPARGGTRVRLGMKVLQHKGVCTEACWPYAWHPDRPELPDYVPPCTFPGDVPCKDADKEAANYRIGSYVRLANLEEIKDSLFVNGPCVLGVTTYPNWFRPPALDQGLIDSPKPDELVRPGGHAVCAVGYDDKKKLLKFKNSWGTGWGDQGYGYMPYDYVNQNLHDGWATMEFISDPTPLISMKQNVMAAITAKLGISFLKI